MKSVAATLYVFIFIAIAFLAFLIWSGKLAELVNYFNQQISYLLSIRR